ncbi:ING2 protein, partial [Atractosteus spatula]|nr:ING2 protein [Atractosteus spatula]
MLGHYPNVEKTQLVSYVEDYLECVESLPLDLQRNVSLLREIDTKYQGSTDHQPEGRPRVCAPKVKTDFGESAILAADGVRKLARPALCTALLKRWRCVGKGLHPPLFAAVLLDVSTGGLPCRLWCLRGGSTGTVQPPPVEGERFSPLPQTEYLQMSRLFYIHAAVPRVKGPSHEQSGLAAGDCVGGGVGQEVLKEVDEVYERFKREPEPGQRRRLQSQLQRALIGSQELGDEKLHVVAQMLELVENRARQMESHAPCLQEPAEAEKGAEKGKPEAAPPERASARRPRRQRNSESRDSCHAANGVEEAGEEPAPREKKSKSSKKKKRSKAKQEREVSPVEFAIDPNEPTYCLCNQVSYGEMIGCDNEECPIEWFHFSCVGLTYKPKGKWYCPKCRGDSEKTMDKSIEKAKKDRRSR